MDSLVKNKLMTKPMVLPQQPVEVVLQSNKEGTDIRGVTVRDARKKNKDFDTADLIRNELDKSGIQIKDSREGSSWEIK